jgi:hypothetical protein
MVARAICAIIIALVLVLDVASVPAAYALIQTPCAPCDPNSIQATTLQVQGLNKAGVSLRFYALFTVSVIVVTEMTYIGLGVLLFLRRSDDRMTLFTALVLVTCGGAAFTGTMHAFSNAGGWLWLITNVLNIIGQSAFIIFLYVFPTGRFVPRWMIGPAVLWCAAWVIPLFHNSTLSTLASVMTDGPVFIAIILSMIVAQVYRYQRVSSPSERQQTKWVVYGLGVGLSAFISILVSSNVILPEDVRNNAVAAMVGSSTTYLCFLLIPIGIVAAVTRSRLFDIDILIKRTLVYGSLTAILAALYFALVIGAQTLTHQLTGQQVAQQPIVIVLSTLLIAALVQPLRRRLQGWIDRRFYRSRYNAATTVAAFSASLRNEVNLQQLNEHLLSVVLETMRPTHASLWLRSPAQRGQNGDVGRTK